MRTLHTFCSVESYSLCNFSRRHYEEYFCEIILNLGQWLRSRRRCHLKIFLFLTLVAILFRRMKSFVENGRGHYGQHSCEIISDLKSGSGDVISGGHFFQWSGTINFGRGLWLWGKFMRDSFNFNQQFGRCCFKIFLFLAPVATLLGRAKPFMQFW